MGLSELREGAQQYSDLTETDAVELLAEMVETYAEHLDGIPADMAKVVLALKARHEATRVARVRVGEYLRQQQIVQDKYEHDLQKYNEDKAEGRKIYSTPKAPADVLGEVRSDEYAGTARLRVSDLRQVVPVHVWDSKATFEATQAERLAHWQQQNLSEKQAALLPCIAEGHITSHGSGAYRGKSWGWRDEVSCTCARIDGRTVNALIKKGVVGFRSGIGYNSLNTLMLKAPSK